ncbi:hypothetical protein [Maricaulis maris]|uniref:hypothetical protein n=1 Tax=Maricaulis maris TaxID=74318 RepID=UPI003B8BB345
MPDTPTGKLVEDFMAALAGDADAHRAFIEARFTPDLLAVADMDQHVSMFAQLAADFGGQPVTGFTATATQARITVFAAGLGEHLAITFDTTAGDPVRIAGLQTG